MQASEARPSQPPAAAAAGGKTGKGGGGGGSGRRRGQGGGQGAAAREQQPQAQGNKVRVTVYKLVKGQKPDSGKALILPESWTEFLKIAAKKLNVSRVESVETEDGTIVEELNEIMQGDKLMLRCKASEPGPASPAPATATAARTEGDRAAEADALKKRQSPTGKEPKPPKVSERATTERTTTKKKRERKGKGKENGLPQEIESGIEEMQKNLIGIIGETQDSSPVDFDQRDGRSLHRSVSLNQRTQGLGVELGRDQTLHRSFNDMGDFEAFRSDGGRVDSFQGQMFLRPNDRQDFAGMKFPKGGEMMRINPMVQNPATAMLQRSIKVDNVVNGGKRPDQLQGVAMNVNGGLGGGFSMMQSVPDGSMMRGNAEYSNMMANHVAQYLGPDHMHMQSKLQGLSPEQFILQQQALILAAQMNARQEPGMPQNAGRRSHEQARFSPLVQVLRDHMVQNCKKDMELDLVKEKLSVVLPDWQFRLNVSTIADYINEAAQAGLVMVQVIGNQQMISVRGDREIGVVKWVKESYGFIQSASHAEDLFYHSSEVRAARPLVASDEVEFLVVRNPFTGKLNATQIHLLRPNDPPPNAALAYMSGSAMLPPPVVDMADELLGQLTDRMMSMGFSPEQIEESIRTYNKSSMGEWDEQGYLTQDGSGAPSLESLMGMGEGGGFAGPFNPFLALALGGGSKVACSEPNKEPWLFKTKMCKFWPSCPRGTKCWFAHGDEELRKPNSVAFMLAGHMAGQPGAPGGGADGLGGGPMGSSSLPMGSVMGPMGGMGGPPHSGQLYQQGMDPKDSQPSFLTSVGGSGPTGGGLQWPGSQQQQQAPVGTLPSSSLDGGGGGFSGAGGAGAGAGGVARPFLGSYGADSVFWAPSGPSERPAETENFYIPADFPQARKRDADSPTNLSPFDSDLPYSPFRSAAHLSLALHGVRTSRCQILD